MIVTDKCTISHMISFSCLFASICMVWALVGFHITAHCWTKECQLNKRVNLSTTVLHFR